MVDTLDPEQRSFCMSRIRGRNTAPELKVRSMIHRLGFRFRIHRRDLPGTPDIVLPRLKKVVLVHGCFWHIHTCRSGRTKPKANAAYWRRKRLGNVERDRHNVIALRRLGWRPLVVWECELKDRERLLRKLTDFLDADRAIQRREKTLADARP
jgi:DNA mismatch endonuclease (patch repair protein)